MEIVDIVRFCEGSTRIGEQIKRRNKEMSFCSNCGKPILDGAKFCSGCGAPVNVEDLVENTIRRQVFAGKVVKCPSCGTVIPSFTAICPGCGHEINTTKVSSAIKEFAEKINECDRLIANSSSVPKKGWKSWGKGKKFWWVVLNIYTLCIPLAIYLLVPLLGMGGMATLTTEEKKKAALIDNFVFPNDRESILEALLYIRTQIGSLESGKIDRNTAYWTHIWKNKSVNIYQKAEILFKGDRIANDAYRDILLSEKKVKKLLRIRAIAAVVLMAALVMVVFSLGGA